MKNMIKKVLPGCTEDCWVSKEVSLGEFSTPILDFTTFGKRQNSFPTSKGLAIIVAWLS